MRNTYCLFFLLIEFVKDYVHMMYNKYDKKR